MPADEDPQNVRTLAEKVDYLFRNVRKANAREYSNDEVSAAIAADQGVSVSSSYLWYLRTGQRDNPTFKHLNALAKFFGVPPAYFFDDATTTQVEAELALLTAMQDAGVRDVALRASGLSAKSLDAITDMIAHVRELEGLTPFDDK